MKKVLVTGAAGFIGFHLCKKLIDAQFEVFGIDNLNAYYDVRLKLDRLRALGVNVSSEDFMRQVKVKSTYANFNFWQLDLVEEHRLGTLFSEQKFDIVVNLAAQAGVRYSIDNPKVYVQSNIVGFVNLLEMCRHHQIKHLVYASSSSVYGDNNRVPFKENDPVDHPISLYAATKKSNELMAHVYSHLYGLKTTGLRFFTVYGPWGRPDMAPFLFAKAIVENTPIKVFNEGHLKRDFTYIDDIIEGVYRVVNNNNMSNDYKIYNIGNSKPESVLDFIKYLETHFGKKANKTMMPMQPGDVHQTYADTSQLKKHFDYSPVVSLNDGLKKFVSWYNLYYNIK